MNLRLLFLFLFLAIGTSAQAQNGFYEPGYILQAGDTITGLVERTNELELSLGINFKKDQTAEVQHFGPGELRGFGFQGNRLHFEPVKATIKALSPNDKVTRFAKKLGSGYASLYKLQLQQAEHSEEFLQDNTYIYLVKKDTAYFTLAQYEVIIENRMGVDKRYLGTLTFLLKDCSGISPSSIHSLPFKDEPMLRLIQKYNTCKDASVPVVEFRYKVKPIIKRGPEAGVAILNAPLNTHLVSSQGYWGGFFWDMIKPDLSRKISTRVGINYLLMNYNMESMQYDGSRYRFMTKKEQAHFVRLPLWAQYNFLNGPTNSFSPFLNLGITMQGSAYSDFQRIELFPFLNLGAGAYVKDLKVSLNVEVMGIYLKGDKIFSLGVGYVLKKNNKDRVTQ